MAGQETAVDHFSQSHIFKQTFSCTGKKFHLNVKQKKWFFQPC